MNFLEQSRRVSNVSRINSNLTGTHYTRGKV